MKDILFSFSKTVNKTRSTEILCLPYYQSVENELIADLNLDTNSKITVRQVYRFIACNDKAKIPIGELNYPISTSACQRQGNLITENLIDRENRVLDHDFSKALFMPSVELDTTTPKKRESSWLDGYLNFVLHEAFFQPSSGWFYAANLAMRLIKEGACAAKIDLISTIKELLELDKDIKKKY